MLVSLAGGLTFSAAHAAAATSGIPEVTIYGASLVTKTSAAIEVGINPEGSQTTYAIWLECESADRDAPGCETSAADPQRQEGEIAAGSEVQRVTAPVDGLKPAYLYKYGVVATNSVGKAGYVGNGLLTCPSEGPCPAQPWLEGDELWIFEAAQREAEEAPRLEAERQAERKQEEERPAREAAERAAKEREIREAGERAGKESAERDADAAAKALRCVVPRLVGDSLAAARRALDRAHCRLGKVSRPRAHLGALVVARQGARGGRKLARGAKVAVTLAPMRR